MGRYLSKFIPLIALVALLTGVVITSEAQPVGAQVTSVTVRLGVVPDPDPSGPLFEGPFTRRHWATFIDGRSGGPQVIVVEVRDSAPAGGATNEADTIQVKVVSDTDETGISNLVLMETSDTSNGYRGTFVLDSRSTSASTHPGIADPTNPSRPTLEVDEGDEVVVTYRNRVASLEMEVEPPRIRNFLPEHDSFLTTKTVTVTAQVVDEESGIDEDDVFFVVSNEQLRDLDIFVAATDRDGNFLGLGLEPLDLLPAGNPDGIIDNFFIDDEDDEIDEDAIYFEADRDLPNPRVTPKNGGEIARRDTVFLTVDFSAVGTGETVHEGNEYRGDTHDEVTLTMATLDGMDVLGSASSADRQKWLISASNLGVGSHTLVINARDEAGNELDRDLEIRFRVVAGERFELPLSPGWNLVSFPGAPANPAIDSVFPPTRAIKTVYSFDPLVPGRWQVAVRDRRSDGRFGAFIGDLKTIRAERGYWVLTDTSEDVQIDLLRVGVGSSGATPPDVPPQIDIFQGWNLVPVIDLTRQLEAGDVIDSDVYFAGLEDEVVRIYTFDETTSQWKLIVCDGRLEMGTQQQLTQPGAAGACATCPLAPNEAVVVGKAYWIFSAEEGVLVP